MRRPGRWLISGLVTALLVFVTLEMGVRWLLPFHNYFANYRRFIRLSEHIPESDRLFTRDGMFPKSPTMTGRVRARTDRDGFLLPTGEDPLRQAGLTIAFLGGSTTESRWVDEARRWPYLTGRLVAQATGRNVRAINAGVSATTLHHSLNVFTNKLLKHAPDLVVITHVINDCAFSVVPGGYEQWAVQSANDRATRLLYEWATSHSDLLGLLRHQYAVWQMPRGPGWAPVEEPQGEMPDPVVHERGYVTRLRMMVALVRAAGGHPVLATETSREFARQGTALTPMLACYRAFNAHVREIAAETNAPLLDLERTLRLSPDDVYDSLHFTDSGSTKAAVVAADVLVPLVAR